MIHGDRIILRAIDRQDLPDYVRWLNDPKVLEYFGNPAPLSLAQEEQWYEQMLQDPETCAFAVDFEGQHIGGAGFHQIDGRQAHAEIGLFIGPPELWDRGLGNDVLQTMLRFGFEQMNLHRIYLRVFAENKRAIRLYEKVGFQHEGCWRQSEFRHGRYHDLLWMSILRNEWNG
jgi:UDP-4-amino-4,6-dideoxy-N-acetyl-beta-L-altrosamine N-acetyltransferase